VTIAGDRDEGPGKGRGGKKAAWTFALRALHEEQQQPIPQLALPGAPGSNTDFLDLLLTEGIAGVRAAILAAKPIVPTTEEIAEFQRRSATRNAITRISAAYPLPQWLTQKLEFRSRIGRDLGPQMPRSEKGQGHRGRERGLGPDMLALHDVGLAAAGR
jgi:hypothetical protein